MRRNFEKTASGLEKRRNIAQKRRYREHCWIVVDGEGVL